MVDSMNSGISISVIAALFAFLLIFMSACTSPSQDGVQGHLKASLPVEGVISFE